MGNINVYTGPMKCGKTQKILNEMDRQIIAGKEVLFFKPTIDDRFGKDTVLSRSGKGINAINIDNIEELGKYQADDYFIDEFQFLKGNIDTIEKMAAEGKKFYIAGLNLTAEKKTFGKMGDLMCLADKVELMTSICEVCKSENAIFSYFKGGKSQEIVIGDTEYIPVCRKCYEKLGESDKLKQDIVEE